jgi:phage protein D
MLRPIILIILDGRDISSRFDGRILRGEIVEKDGDHADTLTLEISNHDGAIAKPRTGAIVVVMLGYEGFGVEKVGQYKVQSVVKIGAGAAYEITAEAADFAKTLKQQKSRSWTKGKTLGDVFNRVAGDNGLTPAISAEIAQIKIDKIVAQTQESDIHLATRIARKHDAICKVAEGRLVVVPKGKGETASGAAMEAVTITPNDLEGDFRITSKDRPKRGKVKAVYYDRDKAERKELEEGGGDDPSYTLPQVFGSETEARKAAAARKREFGRAEKSFSATLRTALMGVKAGCVLQSAGFGDDDDQQWTVKQVNREFGEAAGGYIRKFEAETKKDK